MSLALLYSRARSGIDAPLVTVEVHLANGLPSLSIVGLPEMAVRESKDRVRGALVNSRFEFPRRRITINLAPADLPKEGGRFDLPIALGILAASGQIPDHHLPRCEFIGELALSGRLRPVKGVLPVALAARDAGRALVLPRANAGEAARLRGLAIHPADGLLELCDALIQDSGLDGLAPPEPVSPPALTTPDLSEVRGQPQARRALEVAAAGGHSLLLIGPPGSGKSMLAGRLPGILPPMTEREALETAAILSVSHGGFDPASWMRRPFRAPHHTASGVALVGGGGNPRPGEVSLAHNGVLFLDELPEFDRRVLEVLREPLESGHITISRAGRQADFPARFQLLAAMNPCPCGHLGDDGGPVCRCSEEQVARYRGRVSGPLLDRIDMHVEVPRLPAGLLTGEAGARAESSARVRERVEACRRRQLARNGGPNSELAGHRLEDHCRLDREGIRLMLRAMDRLGLSARAYHRILRLARTIADLDAADAIRPSHLSEAIGYRRLDRRNEE
ncbi:MAG TPA: ATP-dependent protease [Sedimenticola thiotaurini]|uniref:ATP-dependent protease n=1 Tax=Sedimenticola thiotaurini TaxID=1543721 RepID=A0A831RR94_9GAMM|nr:ATP-dependent protease [Sedimenticola thiotaurini]